MQSGLALRRIVAKSSVMKPLGLLLITIAALFTACHHTGSEGPETSPVGPPVLSEAAMQQALTGPVQFKAHVQPLLMQNCMPCHDGKQMPHLANFTSRASVMSRGPYGDRIVPGHPEKSLLVGNLSLTHAPVKTMPPVGSRMTPEETKILKKWIREGAVWPAE